MITIFLHIPRTAGTTLTRIAQQQWPSFRFLRVHGKDLDNPGRVVLGLSAPLLQDCKMLGGHFAYGIHRYLPPGVEYRYITLLREPVARVISLYKYARLSGGHFLHKHAMRMSLGQFVKSGVSISARNGMVFQLSGAHGEILQRAYASQDSPVEGSLRAAMRHLRGFAYVGILERFDSTLSHLNELLGWESVPYKSQNVTGPGPLPSSQDVQAVVDLNRLDIQLYQCVVGGMR